MAFNQSSQNIHLEGTTLHADCGKGDGQRQHSQLHLDRILGNLSGSFVWMGTGFSQNAQAIRLEGVILHARLPKRDGWCDASVDLNERITNRWGTLCYMDRWHGFYSPRGTPNENEKVDFVPHTGFAPCDDFARRGWDAAEAHKMETKRIEAEIVLDRLPPFKYPRLPSTKSIRLLKIEDSKDTSDIICCSLVVVDLKKDPHYDALSYTWGNPFTESEPTLDQYYERTTSISCNGQRLQVKQNLYDALRRLRKSLNTETRGSFKKTPLIQAAEDGHTRLVQTLLLQGANVTSKDVFGETALHYAAENGHINVVKVLVQVGSSLTTLDKSGRTPVDCARQKKRGKYEEVIDFLETQATLGISPDRKGTYFRTAMTNQKYIWIDAICINQNDNREKASQVALMGRIYKSAKSVIAWLGRERQEIGDSRAEDLLLDAWQLEAAGENGRLDDATMDVLLDDPQRHLSPRASPNLKSAVDVWLRGMGEGKLGGWLAGVSFFQRRWFERAWIIQELIMAQELTVLCGQFVFSWEMFVLLSCVVDSCRVLMRKARNPLGGNSENFDTIVYRSAAMASRNSESDEIPPVTLERRRRAFRRAGLLPSISALSLSRNFDATDTRDKVFAVLSISSPLEHSTPPRLFRRTSNFKITPDYVQSAKDLYIAVGKSLIEAYGPCILSLVRHDPCSTVTELPSWVPDLTIPIYHQPLGLHVSFLTGDPSNTSSETTLYSAAGKSTDSPAAFQITPDNLLILQGSRWDTIEEVAQHGLNNINPDVSGLAIWARLLSNLNNNATLTQNRELLWRTLLCDSALGQHPAPDLNREFIGWLKFLCWLEMTGCRSSLRTSKLQTLKKPMDALHPQRSTQEMLATFGAIQQGLSSLGISFSNENNNNKNVGEFERWKSLCSDFTPADPAYTTWFYGLNLEAKGFADAAAGKGLSEKRVFRTRGGFLGTGPEGLRVGDGVFVLAGSSVPHVLRGVGGNGIRDRVKRWSVVGELYVHGAMHGEVVDGSRHVVMEDLCIV